MSNIVHQVFTSDGVIKGNIVHWLVTGERVVIGTIPGGVIICDRSRNIVSLSIIGATFSVEAGGRCAFMRTSAAWAFVKIDVAQMPVMLAPNYVYKMFYTFFTYRKKIVFFSESFVFNRESKKLASLHSDTSEVGAFTNKGYYKKKQF